jgi:amino acid transporter
MLYVAGKAFQVGALIFSTITVLASGMAAHAGVARLMYVMGRDGVFPKASSATCIQPGVPRR